MLKTQEAKQIIADSDLKNAAQLIEFLHSPHGKMIISRMRKEASQEEQLREYYQQQLLSEEQENELSLAILLTELVDEREAAVEALNRQISNDIEAKNKKTAEEVLQNRTKKDPKKAIPIETLTKQLAVYQEAEEAIKHLLDTKYTEATVIEEELARIETLLQEITTQHEQHEHYEQSVERLFADYRDLSNGLAHDNEKVIPTLEEQMKALSAKLHQGAERIGHAIAEEREAHHHPALIEPQHALNLQMSALQEILSVLSGNTFLYTAAGNVTSRFEDATFVLRKDKKLIRENGVCYLLDEGQELDKLAPEAKTACRRPEHELFGIQQRIRYQKSQYEAKKTETHQERSRALLQSETLQQDIFSLTNQLTKVQAASATIRTLIREASSTTRQQSTLTLTPPMPTPSAKSTPATSRYATQSYHHILLLMKERPTKKAIQGLTEYVTNAGLSLQDRQALQGSINRIIPGRPISPGLMRLLLSRENAIGSSLRHQDLASGLDDYEPSSPSPFSMTPFGKKP